jgi:hypothetical protein
VTNLAADATAKPVLEQRRNLPAGWIAKTSDDLSSIRAERRGPVLDERGLGDLHLFGYLSGLKREIGADPLAASTVTPRRVSVRKPCILTEISYSPAFQRRSNEQAGFVGLGQERDVGCGFRAMKIIIPR